MSSLLLCRVLDDSYDEPTGIREVSPRLRSLLRQDRSAVEPRGRARHLCRVRQGSHHHANTAGSRAAWTVQADAAAGATLDLRYANGTTVDRPMDITGNGTRITTGRPFPPTVNRETWATTSLPITPKAGANTVRATSTTADGGPNLDRITIR